MLLPELMTITASPPHLLLPPTTTNTSSTRGVVVPSRSSHLQNVNMKALSHVPAHGIDPTKMQLPCANCEAILNMPQGLIRFSCPQRAVELAVDISKAKQFFPPPLLSTPPPEEVNEVAIEVEREEDEAVMVGEIFTDYRPAKLSIGPLHPDPIVEASSLFAVEPPEPMCDLQSRTIWKVQRLCHACRLRHWSMLVRGTSSIFQMVLGQGSFLEMELGWVKVKPLQV